MTEINFSCPHCEHHYSAETAFSDAGDLHNVQCESCDNLLYFLIQECPKCTAETVFRWKVRPTWEAVALLACGSCGNSFNNLEALEEDD